MHFDRLFDTSRGIDDKYRLIGKFYKWKENKEEDDEEFMVPHPS